MSWHDLHCSCTVAFTVFGRFLVFSCTDSVQLFQTENEWNEKGPVEFSFFCLFDKVVLSHELL